MIDTPLTILLLTAAIAPERAEYSYRTLHAVLDNIVYDGPLFVHIADDGSAPEHRNVLAEIAGGYASVKGVGVSNAEGLGYGRSFNIASQAIHAHGDNSLVLALEDDWILSRPLNAGSLVGAFGPDIGCIRLGYLGLTNEIRGTVKIVAGHIYLHLDPESTETYLWTGHPRLETVAFQRSIGPWPEGLQPGATELGVCGITRRGIAWPLDVVRADGDLFLHIGSVSGNAREPGVLAAVS